MSYTTKEVVKLMYDAIDRVQSLADAAEAMHEDQAKMGRYTDKLKEDIAELKSENEELKTEIEKLKGEE